MYLIRLNEISHDLLTTPIISLLNNRNIQTIVDFLQTDSNVLTNITDLSLKDITDIRKTIIKKYGPKPVNGYDLYKNIVTNSAIISTGIKGLDKILQGGFLTGNIYEIYGLPASGKTYLCLTIAKNISLQEIYQNIVYIDTKRDFNSIQMKYMFNDINDKEKAARCMEKLSIKQIEKAEELYLALCEIVQNLENGTKLRLIIIDSLPALILSFNKDNITERNAILNHIVNIMRFIVNKYHITIIITNLVTLWNEGDFQNVDEFREKIACGKYWQDIANCRIKLEKCDDNVKVNLMRYMKVMPSICEEVLRYTEFGFE